MLGLARKLADGIQREPVPSSASARAGWISSERDNLKQVVHYSTTAVKHPWAVANTKEKGVETRSYRFELSNGLSATGIWIKGITTEDDAPATIMLKDEGKKSASLEISDRVNRGEQVLALDLLLTGDASPADPNAEAQPPYMALLLATLGDRPMGIEVSQLIAITRWLQKTAHTDNIRVECTGIRNQVRALIASALEPTLYREIVVHQGIRSLSYLLDAPITFDTAPDLFCLDLYKDFDLDRLAVLAEPTTLLEREYLEATSGNETPKQLKRMATGAPLGLQAVHLGVKSPPDSDSVAD
jgi:hypothetical protein